MLLKIARRVARPRADWNAAALELEQQVRAIEHRQVMERQRGSMEGPSPSQQQKVDLLLDAIFDLNHRELAVFRLQLDRQLQRTNFIPEMKRLPRTHPLYVAIVEGFYFGSIAEREEIASQLDGLSKFTQAEAEEHLAEELVPIAGEYSPGYLASRREKRSDVLSYIMPNHDEVVNHKPPNTIFAPVAMDDPKDKKKK